MPAGDLESDRYDIGRLLGRGGLGEVYLAHDRVLGRDVAIKYVSAEKVADGGARRALLREARAAAGLDHPGICAVHEAGETADGRAFIVMQHVEGETLSAVLQHGAMAVRDALTLCAEVAEALGAAHRRGVIHRDLKPGNIMVTPGGRPKLVDFGIAKVILSQTESGNAPTVTSTGIETADLLVGTPAYMSPEQIQHRPVDGRSDLFSLGLVLFECLTGRRAIESSRPLEAFNEILHVHPPPPSSLRPELTEAHDELCRRLLAKDPADRFQSAEEVVGAIRVLLPDTSRTPSGGTAGSTAPVRRTRRAAIAALIAAIVGLAGIGGIWMWLNRGGLPEVPAAAAEWYRTGTEAIRQGAYQTGRKRLEQAVKLFPQHALAYARLAEADAELDDPAAAKDHLLRVNTLVPDESRLPAGERLRMQAMRAIVLRDVDGAISRYRELVALDPSQADSLMDLGRAQEAAGRNSDARRSYEQVIAGNPEYAAAYLRLGRIEALESRRKAALVAFAEAERLYTARSDGEGHTEVLLSRGKALEALGESRAARVDLERALQLATSIDAVHQRIRVQLALSSVTASEGKYTDAERLATAVVAEATAKGLDTIAADGLVDLASVLILANKAKDAEAHLERARRLAEGRGAGYTAARAKATLAEAYRRMDRHREALVLLAEVLRFAKENRYRRLEFDALSIAARSHDNLGELEQARRIASEVLAVAVDLNDERQEATAASSLASVSASLGHYPEALRLRERADAIHRRQDDKASLPYDLTNRADMLIRLGRHAEADKLLVEVEAGIAAGIDSYVGRQRRVAFLRALGGATAGRCGEAFPFLDRLEQDANVTDSAAALAPGIRAFCEAQLARRGRAGDHTARPVDPVSARERQYWLAAAAMWRADGKTALAEASRGLSLLADTPNDELRWRLASVASIAARNVGNATGSLDFARQAREARERVKKVYNADFTSYEGRSDLAGLKKREQG